MHHNSRKRINNNRFSQGITINHESMSPLEMIQRELNLLLRCREKSIISYGKGDIDFKLHQTHFKNLNPKIKEYESAIEKLKN